MLKIANRVKLLPNHQFSRPKGHPFWTFSYLISGSVRQYNQSQTYLVESPSFSLRQPNSAYSLEIADPKTPCEEIYAVFAPPEHWQAWLQWDFGEDGRVQLPQPTPDEVTEIEKTLNRGLEHWKSLNPNRNALFMNALEKVFILLDSYNPRHQTTQIDQRIQRTLRYMRNHFAEKIAVEDLAREAGLSTSRFAELFREQLHLTPMQQLEQYRLEQAFHKLLTDNSTVEEIAFAVGFESASHFSTRFRKRYNHSPRQHRERAAQRNTSTSDKPTLLS